MDFAIRIFIIFVFFTVVIALFVAAVWAAAKIARRADSRYEERLNVLCAPPEPESEARCGSSAKKDKSYEEDLFTIK